MYAYVYVLFTGTGLMKNSCYEFIVHQFRLNAKKSMA